MTDEEKRVVKELENLKVEILKAAKKTYKFPYEEAKGLDISDRFIDKRIAEIKGE